MAFPQYLSTCLVSEAGSTPLDVLRATQFSCVNSERLFCACGCGKFRAASSCLDGAETCPLAAEWAASEVQFSPRLCASWLPVESRPVRRLHGCTERPSQTSRYTAARLLFAYLRGSDDSSGSALLKWPLRMLFCLLTDQLWEMYIHCWSSCSQNKGLGWWNVTLRVGLF